MRGGEHAGRNVTIGNPVVAKDTDGDILTYTLDRGWRPVSFDINWATGQIMTKVALNFERTRSYEVTVKATDPAGVPQYRYGGS